MFQALRKHLTPSTFIAFLALVFALTGGAFAASSHGGGGGTSSKTTASVTRGAPVTTAAKSRAKPKTKAGSRGPAGPAGKTGATGPAGAQGAQGAQGPAGAAGAKGETGPAGANGTNGTNGTNGETGFTETLPPEKTEKGMWAASTFRNLATEGVSFDIPLAAAPIVGYVNVGGKELTAAGEQTPVLCKGSAADPTAPEGALCVYAHLEHNVNTEEAINKDFFDGWKWGVIVDNEGGGGGGEHKADDTATPYGFDVTAIGTELEGVDVNGTWAVTAE